MFVGPTKQNADIVVDFTYRRLLLTKLLTMLLADCIRPDFNTQAFVRELRAESQHLGFIHTEGRMPVSVDIMELAKAYPESTSAKPSLVLETNGKND